MKLSGEFIFLGEETKTSKKGNIYNVVTLIQGVDTLTVMSDIKLMATFGDKVNALLDYEPKYKNLKLIDIK